MKNKEIEYLLNEMKDTTQDYIGTNGCKYQDLLREEIDLLLSYIEQLEKENQQLKKQKDDVVEYIKSNCILSDEWTELDFCNFVPTGKINYKALNKEKVKDLLRMLGEIDV